MQVFETILQDDKVKGKPILMLCNKADIDEAKDEVHVVNTLKVESLVNIARCPTRVEPSVATKNHGLKEGFKWIVKSIIANMSDLGPRIDKDVEEEQQKEAERNELNLRQKNYQFSFHFYRYTISISCHFISLYLHTIALTIAIVSARL